MKKFIFLASIIMFSLQLFSMDDGADFQPDDKVISADSWGSKPRMDKHDLQKDKGFPDGAYRIIIGHTVTDLGDSAKTVKHFQTAALGASSGSADGPYHFCLDKDGFCFEMRPLDVLPAILGGQNAGSCGVGLVGNFHENVVTQEMAKRFGKHLGRIAHLMKLEKLKRNVNIFAMSELSSRFPISPGENFMKQFDYIVEIANRELARRQTK